MLDVIKSKQNQNVFFTPALIYIKMKDRDFGQKKVPAPYLTYLCLRVLEHAHKVQILSVSPNPVSLSNSTFLYILFYASLIKAALLFA